MNSYFGPVDTNIGPWWADRRFVIAPGSTPMSAVRRTRPQDLMRLYGQILLWTGGAALLLHGVFEAMGTQGSRGSLMLLLDGVLMGFGLAAIEYSRGTGPNAHKSKRSTMLFLLAGIFIVLVTFESGGLASPFFILLLMTCVFAGTVLTRHRATVITCVLALFYALCAWLFPSGITASGLAEIELALRRGRIMPNSELISLGLRTAFLFLGVYVATRALRRFNVEVTGLTHRATRDPLTNLPNRRAFVETMAGEIARAERYSWPLSVLMMDLDFFKRINDVHGHSVGDSVLREAAAVLRDTAGPMDHMARVGGEEFAIAAVAADPGHGMDLAARVVKRMAAHNWSRIKPGLEVTCSVGVSVLDAGSASTDPERTLDDLLSQADRALYQVKQNGRNNFHVWGHVRSKSARDRDLAAPTRR